MSTPPTPGRGGRWANPQQAAFNNQQGRGRGPRQQGRGTQQGRQAQNRGRGANQRGGFTGGRGRGTMNMPQQMNAQFVVRPGGLQQPQFPGSIPSAPTQQVVMVPNHLLQQAVSPYPIAYPFNQNNIAMAQMPQFAQQFVHPQQQAAAQAMLLQQQQNAARLRANQQTQQQHQQQAAQQQQQAANQATNRAAPGKTAPTPQTSSPPQQATPANQMPTQNQPQPNQPSGTPIHPMNANQQQQFYVMPQVNAYGQQFFVRKGMQQPQIVNSAMMNPMIVQQQQQALMQQQAMMQRAHQQAAAQQQARNMQQQHQAAQQQAQQQQDKEKPKQQPQAVNYMQLQPQMYANQPQVRMGGPIPQMAMAQPSAGANQPGWPMGFQQPNQAQRPNAQQPNATGAQPSRPPTMQNQQVPSKPPQVSTLISKPPTSSPSPNVQAEMMKKFKQAAVDGGKAASPGTGGPKKAGTPLSAAAPVFVPGSFSSPAESDSPAPSQPPQEMNKKDPTQQQPMAMPSMIPPTIVPAAGVPAENPKPQQPVVSAWNQPKPSQPPPAAKTTAGDAEANVLNMFDPGAMKKVQEKNNVGPEDMAELVQPTVADPSDITSEDVQDKEEISSPRSQLSVEVNDSETVDDENEEEENKADELDVENRIYTISQLIKIAKDTECQEIHEVLKSPKYNSIKAQSCVAVHDIIDSSKMNSRRRPSKYHNQGGMSRAGWGTGINKRKKTPRNKKPGGRGKYDQYPPLLRVDPLEKDMNNSWWATHRKKNSPLDNIRKKSLALLNKLTLENKDTICEQFTSHIVREVKSSDECNVVVSTIFEKSCAEAKFSNLYADLCHVVQSNLSGVKPNLERETNPESVKENEDMKGLFRRSIINLCQLNFNRRLSLDPIEGSDEEIITQLDNTKRKMMGNIKFIGDLFKHKLIHESIVHHIIAKLLTPRDKDYDSNSISRRKLDDQLEGCCRLLQTVGKQIDVPKAKEWIDQYFDYMIHYQKNAQNRIHFMVLEIKELRDNRWVPRREIETVKLKEEVRKEFEREQMEKARGPHKGKRGVKPTARKPNDFRDNRGRRDNTIRGSTNSGGNAWARNRTPSSAPKMKKSGSQDIRGNSYSSVRSPNPSRPPQSGTAPPISRKTSSAPAPINIDALQKEWDEFGNSKRIPEAKLDKFLNVANNPAAQKARWSVFFKHFVCNAQAETQKQMMTSLRFHNRSNKVNPQSLLQCLVEVASKVEAYSDDFDVPKAAEYYGYLVSELVITQRMQVQEVVSKFAPQNLEKQTFVNMYMTGVLRELATCEEPDGPAFIEQHASVFARGFLQNPNDYGKPARRNKIPTAQELPVIEVVLGENAV